MECLAGSDSRLVRATECISSVSHCLRELLENSIDAGSSIITCHLTECGLGTLTVSDNGCGISRDGLALLCNEGTTSKQFGGAQHGGRGKALDSICALSFLTIETSCDESGAGYKLQFGGDGARSIRPCSRPRGTSVTVQTLFYPHAVRRRYWIDHKAQNIHEIHEVAAAFALAFGSSLSVAIDSKTIVHVSKQPRAHRIRQVLGVSNGLISRCESLGGWTEAASVEYFTTSSTSASNGRLFLNVNDRPCVNHSILRAIRQEFRLCAGPKVPTVVLWINAPRSAFDFLADEPLIAVTFSREPLLQTSLCGFLRDAWKSGSETLAIRKSRFSLLQTQPPPAKSAAASQVTASSRSALTTEAIAARFRSALGFVQDFGESATSISSSSFSQMELIGQWNLSFIIARLGADVYAIDQHAACEAANFESFRKTDSRMKQRLICPIQLPIPPEDQENAALHQQRCAELGFEYNIIENGVELLTVPAGTNVVTTHEDFRELLGLIHDMPGAAVMTAGARSRLAYRSCHASVRAGDSMSHSQMRGLLERMANSEYPWNCPHGRPTWCCIYHLQGNE